ncbi:hypothetical protein FI667_g15091, partial [Globisporangium splendens]
MLTKFGMQHLPSSSMLYSKLAQSIGSVNSVDISQAIGAAPAPARPGVSQRPDERIPLLRKQFREIGELWFCPVLTRGFASYLDEMMSADVLYGTYGSDEDGSQDAIDTKWQRHVEKLAEKFHAQIRIELFMLTSSGVDTTAIYEPLFEKCIVAPLTEMTKK